MSSELVLDEIGYWSEIKLDIIRDYGSEYSKIISAQKRPQLYHLYIDGFAGAGFHVSRTSKDIVPGSPLNALYTDPPFREHHWVDLDPSRADNLKELVADDPAVHVYQGDCNRVLIDDIFPQARYEDYRRALCVLDPYGLHLSWDVMYTAGRMKSVELFLNFPVADMNRNVFWRNPDSVRPADICRMNAFWGDESWRQVAYSSDNLFGLPEKEDNETIAEAFRQRLRDSAGFQHLPKPLPMTNSCGATVYYLFFASHKPVAQRIVDHIFNKYRGRRMG